jgi:prephenate dehydratase
MYDTAGSVKFIKETRNASAAAIASKHAAQIYDMKVVEEDIEDNSNNFTRFLIISNRYDSNTDDNKISVIFSISHTPGSLYSILQEFALRNINLTKIESRPTKNIPWEYYFFVDLEGNINDDEVSASLSAVKTATIFFKLLGSYKKDEI